MLTRAKSLEIVIGNANTLNDDPDYWGAFVDYCRLNRAIVYTQVTPTSNLPPATQVMPAIAIPNEVFGMEEDDLGEGFKQLLLEENSNESVSHKSSRSQVYRGMLFLERTTGNITHNLVFKRLSSVIGKFCNFQMKF